MIREGDRVEVLHIEGTDPQVGVRPVRFGTVQHIAGTAYVKAQVLLDTGEVVVLDCPPSRIERVWRRTMRGGWE